ncbi:permease prefix domain 1-containing protein [Microbacterium immunditiarum]|uniref:Flagellar biogenesis protein FliO n=1 Tax=Microbacterium immunditiarum TaxID=337480 RepID=A0A7Y9KMH9_9MICO|nr:permease prefix domain 1-containing protein [Microbacterium immunditiarum]NYE20799.1 flagellar biogenesis protein FliO [Microbacterium immunditiarum]
MSTSGGVGMAGGEQLEERIAQWREFVSRRDAIARDVDELESHLRDQIDGLQASGLAPDEAFLIAVKRMGRLDELSQEFAREHSERLWKHLVMPDAAPEASDPRTLWLALGLAVGAALAVRLASVLLPGGPTAALVNTSVLVLPFLAIHFLVRRRASVVTTVAVLVPFAVTAVVLNAYPFEPDGMTQALSAMHAIVAMWLVVGIAYAGGAWRSSRARMDFIRFSGEWLVYYALIALGGAVIIAITLGVFGSIGIDAQPFVGEWLLPCGAAGAVLVAAWLVEAKQSVVENIAPVLTKVFSPLFTLLLLALIGAWIVQGVLASSEGTIVVFGERDLLIIFDVVVIFALALLLYSLSARDPLRPPGWFDRLQIVLLASVLVVDVLVLVSMVGRIAEYGSSPNKLASLGLNLILLVNLVGATWLQTRFVFGRERFATLESWQTAYLPVYLAWAAVVVAIFPVVFGYV